MDGRRGIVEIGLMGPFTVSVGGVVVEAPWRLRKAKTIVKLLALAPAHRAHRDVLIELLWPEVAPGSGVNNLHQALHAARQVLGAEHIVLRDEVVVLGGDDGLSVDVDEFDAAATKASQTGDPEELRHALDLWKGELLPEDLYEDWATAQRDRLNGVHARVVRDLADALVAGGHPEEAVTLLEPVAVERATDEPLHRSLLGALAAAGRRWEAETAFERLRDNLHEAYGVEPEPETTAAYRRLFVGGAPDAGKGRHNLPTLSTSFVGRHRQLAELSRLLARTRLLTLTGPGGAGKTRLAVELAHRQVAEARRADGVWLVELAGVAHESAVASAVASALELPLAGGRPSIPSLVDQLAARDLLLVLDNCEHVLAGVIPLTVQLLAHCPDLAVLATSREPLGRPGEVAWRVPSLELPGRDVDAAPELLAGFESVQLFVERARDASPTFVLDAATAPAVADICRRLDGIPLALELAAVRIAHLSAAQLAARLGDALGVLKRRERGPGDHHGQADRQQTLAATLDWSHGLLLDDERVAFRRLAVFAGGFDLDGAAAVCDLGDVVDVLGRLVDKSLVAADTAGEAARYHMLEVIRQYALARLEGAGELPACRERHRAWYAREAARHDPDRGVPIVLEPSTWFDVEQDNLRVAFSSALDQAPHMALDLATSTWRFLFSRGQLAEGLAWLTAALDHDPELSPLRARALFATGVLHVRRGDIEAVAGLADVIVEVARRLGDHRAMAAALDQAAIFSLMGHDWPAARRYSAAALERAGGDPSIRACSGHFAGVLALALGEVETARAALAEATAALDRVPAGAPPFFTTLTTCWIIDDRRPVPLPVPEDSMLLGRRVGAAQAQGHIAVAAALAERFGGRVERALTLLDEAVERFTALGDAYGLGYAVSQRGHTLRWAGDCRAALAAFDAAGEIRGPLRDLRAIAVTLAGRSYVEALLGHAGAARHGVEEAVAMMRRSGDVPGVAITRHIEALIELELGGLDAARPPLEESVLLADRVTPTHAIGWQYVLLARVRAAVGDLDGSTRAELEATRRFELLGDGRGRRALLRARKAGAFIMSS